MFGIRDPGSEIRDPRSGIRKKFIPDPGSGTLDTVNYYVLYCALT
jgi:hypothetical protein